MKMIHNETTQEVIKIPGITFIIKVHESATDGKIAIFEEITEPNIGPALHSHDNQTEIFKILAGKYLMQVGDKKIEAKVGDMDVIPPNTPHSFKNIGDEPARLEFSFIPAMTAEEFIRELPKVVKKKEDHKKIGLIAEKYNTTVLGPPISE